MSGRLLPLGRLTFICAALVATAGAGGALSGANGPLRVRTNQAFAPCLSGPIAVFSGETGIAVILEVGEAGTPEADVVVGDDSELTRGLEGGRLELGSSFDLGYLPWVFVMPPQSAADVYEAISGAGELYVLGGRLGRDASAALGNRLPAARMRFSKEPRELGAAPYALVPRSLAGPGEQRPAGIRPLVAVAAAVAGTHHPKEARELLAFLGSPRGHALLSSCLSDASEVGVLAGAAVGSYAAAVVDWWLPQCTLDRNGYSDPQQVLGSPDAVGLGEKDQFRGLMSLGQGGYVTVDMGSSVIDGPGADLRVYQTVSGEPVTVYAATKPQGPFMLLGLRVSCGVRTPGVYSNHCDFDLRDAGLAEARYFKIEDGEIYPCLKAGTITEGADIDAVQVIDAG